MEEENNSSTVVSDAEKRRQERKRKILQNQESRFQKILGPNTSTKDMDKLTGFNFDVPLSDYEGIDASSVVSPTSPIARNRVDQGDNYDSSDENRVFSAAKAASPLQPAKPKAPQRSSRTVEQIQGQFPVWIHRVVLCVFGILLPFLDLNYFLVYFLIWQITIWKFFNGLNEKPPPPNLILTLILVIGLTERQVAKCQQLIRVTSLLWTDLCVFVMSTILSQIIFYGVSQSQDQNLSTV